MALPASPALCQQKVSAAHHLLCKFILPLLNQAPPNFASCPYFLFCSTWQTALLLAYPLHLCFCKPWNCKPFCPQTGQSGLLGRVAAASPSGVPWLCWRAAAFPRLAVPTGWGRARDLWRSKAAPVLPPAPLQWFTAFGGALSEPLHNEPVISDSCQWWLQDVGCDFSPAQAGFRLLPHGSAHLGRLSCLLLACFLGSLTFCWCLPLLWHLSSPIGLVPPAGSEIPSILPSPDLWWND